MYVFRAVQLFCGPVVFYRLADLHVGGLYREGVNCVHSEVAGTRAVASFCSGISQGCCEGLPGAYRSPGPVSGTLGP